MYCVLMTSASGHMSSDVIVICSSDSAAVNMPPCGNISFLHAAHAGAC